MAGERWSPSLTWDEPGEPYAAATETHISSVVFLGDRAYKVKKPVSLPFLDLSRVEERQADAEAELELNRRLAPDVYLGVAAVRGPTGGPPEPVLVMRRLPARARLSTLVAQGADVGDALRDAARRIAVMHAGLPPLDDWDLAERTGALWLQGLEQLAPFEGGPLDASVLSEVGRLSHSYVAGRGALFAERLRGHRVKDGHGDLLADDIFCLDDGVRILDCLEFDASLRIGDVLADTAFLAMDLERLGRPDLADAFLAAYAHFSAETHPRSLAHHYIGYRAFVRAKISCLRHAASGQPDDAERARTLLELCVTHLRAGEPTLVMVGGLPASGKTTIAQRLVEGPGNLQAAVLLSSDVVREELSGRGIGAHLTSAYGEGSYDRVHRDAVYDELHRRAGLALERGESVVLDASWSSERHRAAVRALAQGRSARVVELRCRADRAVLEARLLSRDAADSPSDATLPVLQGMAEHWDPWPDAVEVDTDRPVEDSTRTCRDAARSAP